MKAALGIMLVGGGAFLLVALFNGTLHFPFGQFALGSSTTTSTTTATHTKTSTGASTTPIADQCKGLTGIPLKNCQKNVGG